MSTELLDNEDDTDAFVPPAPKDRVDDELDMTPMVDVTFLLLIFFMVTAAFALQKVLKVPPIPDEEASVVQVEQLEDDAIIVRIDADNVFFIGAPRWPDEQKAQSSLDMRTKVREAREGGTEGAGPKKMVVHAHEDAVYEKLVDALDAGSAAGMTDIQLSIEEDHEF